MNVKIAIILVFSIVSALGLGYFFASSYPFVLASEDARTALRVSDEQFAELNHAAMLSDVIAFAIVGGVLSAGLAVLISNSSTKRFLGLLFGLFLGAGMGALGGWVGHASLAPSFRDSMDPTVYLCVRLIGMSLFVAIAAGIACGIGRKEGAGIGKAIIGSLLGCAIAAILFVVLSGSVTTLEQASKVVPHFLANRILLVSLLGTCMGIGMVLQLEPKSKSSKSESAASDLPVERAGV